MKKYLTLGLAVIITLVAIAATPATASAQSAGLITSIINKMERNRREMRTLRSTISMEKYDAQIRDTDKRVGTLLYIPGAGNTQSVRIDWRSPQEILSVQDGKYMLYRPRLKTVYVVRAITPELQSRINQSKPFDFMFGLAELLASQKAQQKFANLILRTVLGK